MQLTNDNFVFDRNEFPIMFDFYLDALRNDLRLLFDSDISDYEKKRVRQHADSSLVYLRFFFYGQNVKNDETDNNKSL